MTAADRRHFPRFNPQGLKATIYLEPPQDSTNQASVNLEGEVVDISHKGVKIKLREAMPVSVDRRIRIDLMLPESGIPFSISGILKHQLKPTELGLQYADTALTDELDNFMFECIKLVRH